MLLSDLPDSDLVYNIKNCNEYASDSINILSNRHGGMIANIYKKFTPLFVQSGICPRDIFDNKINVVYDTALSYDSNKGAKYSSWLNNHIRYQCLTALNHSHKYVTCASINGNPDKFLDLFPKEEENKEEIYKLGADIIDKIQNKKAKKIFQLRYDADKKMTWRQIGDFLGVTAANVHNIHKKEIEKLRQRNIIGDQL